ncbi:immune-associated nucleotide-binding protein 1 [Elysia marginata]|uniref:Immune-associated nucleotide-binding protein 1 n=1 Tax=Elysia marginata TaxID=1093978 RepID=A0AAV4HYN0_9GAST|nr:immune-associated nucleotide-binding protein 1 [Elysia marginata]
MKEAMLITPEGYHAFLYTIKYPSHFTEEDAEVLETLKKILKPDVIQKHCILLMTGGDNFRFDNKKKGKTFERWILEQKGKFGELIRECGNRVVLFDNKTEDKTIQQAQLDELLAEVNRLQKANGVYTDENFENAKALRERQKAEAKGAVIEEIALEELRLFLDQMLNSDHNDLPTASSMCAQLIISMDKINKDGTHNSLVGNLKDLKEIIDNTFRVVQTLPEEGDKRKEVFKMKWDGEKDKIHDLIKGLEEVYRDLKKRNRYLVGRMVVSGIGMAAAAAIISGNYYVSAPLFLRCLAHITYDVASLSLFIPKFHVLAIV